MAVIIELDGLWFLVGEGSRREQIGEARDQDGYLSQEDAEAALADKTQEVETLTPDEALEGPGGPSDDTPDPV